MQKPERVFAKLNPLTQKYSRTFARLLDAGFPGDRREPGHQLRPGDEGAGQRFKMSSDGGAAIFKSLR